MRETKSSQSVPYKEDAEVEAKEEIYSFTHQWLPER